LNHGSLFSGIGGFDLAAEWMGWENIFNCEIERFSREVLNYYWPNAVSYEDITKTDFTIWRGKIDILTGGFPCQPFSTAGKRRGTEDNRYLWPEMLRAIREIQPRYIVGENVRGLINWNGGLVFKQVLSDLEDEGYEVIPIILPACGKNAPHRRERIWFVAFSNSAGTWNKNREVSNKERGTSQNRGKSLQQIHRKTCSSGTKTTSSDGINPNPNNNGSHDTKNGQGHNKGNDDNPTRKNSIGQSPGCCSQTNDANSIDPGLQGNERRGTHEERDRSKTSRPVAQQIKIPTWDRWPTQPPVCSGDDGISSRLDIETILETKKRKVNYKFKPFSWWRKESIKAYGNAIVPQVAFEIFKVIQCIEQKT